jgi:type VI secretion system protein ImpC
VAQSNQKFIARARAPRVQIEYDVELYGAQKRVQLPFVVGVLADLSGQSREASPPVAERKFREIDIDNFDKRMQAVQPRVAFEVTNVIDGQGTLAIDLVFERLDDFSPGAVVKRIAPLAALLDAREQLATLLTYMDGKAGAELMVTQLLQDRFALQALAQAPDVDEVPLTVDDPPATEQDFQDLLSRNKCPASADAHDTPAPGFDGCEFQQLLQQQFRARSAPARQALAKALRLLAREALAHDDLPRTDAMAAIELLVTRLDRKLSQQLNLILHHDELRRMEGAWRGLYYLVSNTETDESLKIRFMDLSKAELGKTLQRHAGSTREQSPLFKRIHEDEYGQYGGEPYGCLVADHEFDHTGADVALLGEMARICAASHAPLIAGAAPTLMGLASWQALPGKLSADPIRLSSDAHAPWRSLREADESRYLALAMPRFLARRPYGPSHPVEEFDFEEDTGGGDHRCSVWCNAAYAMAVNITRAFRLHGWCATIRGVESGGAVEGLPTHGFPTDDGGFDPMCPTEIAIGDRCEALLARAGLMPLLHRKHSDYAAFVSAQSLHQPFEYDDPAATANASLAARLPYLLACCRFAQYLKCIVRDRIGSFKERQDMQRWLQEWSTNYVDADPVHSSEQAKARQPLAAAEVVLDEVEGNPGYYAARLFLRPHYQLEGLTAALRMVTKISSAKATA